MRIHFVTAVTHTSLYKETSQAHQTSKGLKLGLTLSLPYHLCAFLISLMLWHLGCPAGWTGGWRAQTIANLLW